MDLDANKNTSEVVNALKNPSVSISLEERDQILSYFYAFFFSPVPPAEIPESLRSIREIGEMTHVMRELREVLMMASQGDFSYKVSIKGFIGGLLKSLQSKLNHVAWLTRCVADGDLEQRMDFMGDFAAAFNSMTEQLASTLDELKREVRVRADAEKKLHAEEERWMLAVECSQDGIWEINLESETLPYYSPRLRELTGYSPGVFPDFHAWKNLFHPEDTDVLKLFDSFICGNPPNDAFTLDHRLLCADGTYRWFMTRGILVKDIETQIPSRLIGVTADIQDRKEREELFSHRATHDVLTELPNRLLYDDHLKRNIELAKRGTVHLAVIMVDLDKFKNINDTLGHHAGDVFLIEVAHRLQNSTRESDMVSRFGGDEFALVLSFPKNEWQYVTKVLGRTMKALQQPLIIDGTELAVTASFGISLCPENGYDPKELLKCADEAMYYAKTEGRNACAFWKSDGQHNLVRFNSSLKD